MNGAVDPKTSQWIDDRQADELAALIDEYRARLDAGETVDLESFARRLPGAESVVREVLESLNLVHHFSGVSQQQPDMPCTIGEFEIFEEIGRGGMGIVYRARQRSLDRIVALKILPLAASLDRRLLERFRIETHSASILQHPNILSIYGTGCDQGVHYYAMQLIDGQSLQAHLSAHEQFDVSKIVQWIKTVAEALQHAHRSGVVHRDIKPSNLLIDATGKIWVTDFGLAQMDNQATLTLSGDMVGTLRYMSPEQTHEGRTPLDHRTDIYALGATLYELLTGQPMVTGVGRLEIMRNVMEQEARFKKLSRPVPRDLQTIVLKATAKDRELRYASAAAMAEDLQRYLDNRPILASRPGLAAHAIKLAARHPVASLVTALAPLVFLLVMLLYNMLISAQKRELQHALDVARQNESKATLEARKSTAVSEILQQLVASANPDQTKGAEYTVRQLLDDLSETVFNELDDQPEVAAALRTTIGNAYRRLGSPERALEHLQKALEFHQRSASDFVAARDYTELAWNYAALGKYPQAVELARRAVDIHQSDRTNREMVQAMWCLQHCLIYAERYAEADALFREASELARTIDPTPPELANIVHDAAQSMTRQGLGDQATKLALEAIKLHEEFHGNEHPELGWGYEAYGRALLKAGKPADAVQAFEKALSIFKLNYPAQHKSVRMTLELLEQSLTDSHNLEQLSKIQDDLLRERLRQTVVDTPTGDSSLLALLVKKANFAAAGELIMVAPELFHSPKSAYEAIEILSRYKRSASMQVGGSLSDEVASRLRITTKQLFDQAVRNCPDSVGELNTLAWQLVISEDADFREPTGAVRLARRATELDPKVGACWNTLGLAYLRSGQIDEAISALQRSQSFATTDEYDTVLLSIAHGQHGERAAALEQLENTKRLYEVKKQTNPEIEQFLREAEQLVKE